MLGEVAPFLVPQFDALAVGLLVIAGAFVCLGLVTVIHTFVRATVGGIAGLLGHVPGIGGVLSSPVNKVVHWMEHEFATAEAYLDGVLSNYIHQLGLLFAWMVREIRETSHLLYVLSTAMVGHEALRAIDATLGLVHRLEVRVAHTLDHALGQLRHFESELAHAVNSRIGGAVHTLIKPITADLGALDRFARSRVGALERGVDIAIPGALHGLREWAHGLSREYDALWHRIRRAEALIGTTAFAGAVAIALSTLGVEWIRCRNWRRVGRGVCGMPSALIEGLFGVALEAFLVADLCHFARLIEAAAIEVEPILEELVSVQRFICLGGGASYPSGIVAGDLRARKGHASGIIPADLAA